MKSHLLPLFAFLTLANPAAQAISLASRHADFVRVQSTHFEIQGRPYHFVGTNFWYGMNLGSQGPGGDRVRLLRELDRLNALGVTNLRILAASEGPNSAPWRIVPALQTAPGVFDPALLEGLDFLLSEMGKRGMRAVACLGNFWPWSGGMAQYLEWFGGGLIPYPPPAQGGDWGLYQSYTEKFYSNDRAIAAARNSIGMIVNRTNSITGLRYLDDPTIMAWELANEPRGIGNSAAFSLWLQKTSEWIKTLDPDHLVTTGSEGETPSPASAGVDFVANHRFKSIDYATVHIWAQNWGWFDPENAQATYSKTVAKMKAYFQDHLEKAKTLSKPLVIEEFGLGRDSGSHSPGFSTDFRDRYYAEVFEQVFRAAFLKQPAAGVNFWAWAGEGRPSSVGGIWKPGDGFIGDPPHEPQGWYSVYDADQSTQRIIQAYATKMHF